jgi:hypothetical protein
MQTAYLSNIAIVLEPTVALGLLEDPTAPAGRLTWQVVDHEMICCGDPRLGGPVTVRHVCGERLRGLEPGAARGR